MSETIDLVRDTTMQEIRDYLGIIAAASEVELAEALSSLTYSQVRAIVAQGLAESVYSIGDQLTTTWTDTVTSTSYDCPFDIVAFETVTLEDGEEVPGMILQQHYASKYTVMFDAYEAFYVATDGLSAGTYYVTMGFTYNTNFTSGDTYQFTLTEDVPEGGLLAGFRKADTSSFTGSITDLSIYSYDSDYALIETVSIEEGSSGTSLGTLYNSSAASTSGLNNGRRAMSGYARWSQSAYRQYLNSSADAGEWWESQNDYDMPPDELESYPGYLTGFEDDFLAVLKKIKQTTLLNTVEGLSDTSEDTYDLFFLPSLEQIYCEPQADGEGDYWPYWKQMTGATDPQATGTSNIYEERITYGINSTSSGQHVRLRSAFRSLASNAWCVHSTGFVFTHSACFACRSAPACCIC